MSGNARHSGFTLAELLIALAILGVIATFTIPKVLTAQQGSQYTSAAKEAAAMFSGAYQAYLSEHPASSTVGAHMLTPYMNYVSVDTTSTIDDIPTQATLTCAGSSTRGCLVLHNGGKLYYGGETFDASFNTNVIFMVFDPDGKTSSVKGVAFELFYNGKLSSGGSLAGVNICGSWGCGAPAVGSDPTWFSWN